jgi:hypothetical protein
MPFEARSIAGRFAEIFSRVQRAQVHRLIG